MRTEQLILRNLIHNEDYLRKVLPFLKNDYFSDTTERLIFDEITKFTENYNVPPTLTALQLSIAEKKGLTNDEVEESKNYLQTHCQNADESVPEWLIDSTEKFCQEKAIYNSVLESIHILDGKHKTLEKGAIPKLLSDALAVSFNNSVGHDYIDNADERYEFYHRKEERIPFDLDFFNKITKGGLPSKTLNIALAGTGVGKIGRAHV